jgi:hypothetical protein
MLKTKHFTIDEAISEGYEYCTPQCDEPCLIPILECKFNRPFVLVSKESMPFTISDTLLKELIDDYLSNQDEVGDEDEELNEIAATIDYSQVTIALNKAFSVKKYYFQTDIRLIKNIKP